MDGLLERLSNPLVLIPLLFVAVSITYSQLTAQASIPSDLPWVGKQPGQLFGETRAHLRSFNKVRQWMQDGYTRYSKRGKTYIFPDFSGRPEVIVPPADMAWLLDQPEAVLSVSELHHDILVGHYAFSDPRLLKDPYHVTVLHRNLARRIGSLIMDLWDELGCAIDETWGMDTDEWKEICVFENLMTVIARNSNRIFVGLPLCRNKAYLGSVAGFAQSVFATIMLFRFVPKILEPVFGRLLSMPNRKHRNNLTQLMLPTVQSRLEHMARKEANPSFDWTPPNDYITWHIMAAKADRRTDELDPETICRRLLPLNFGAIHTTVYCFTNCIFDLLVAPPATLPDSPAPQPVLDVIRREAQRAFRAAEGTWSKRALSAMVRTDSAIRESARVSNFLTRGLLRKVVARDGVENKKAGWRLPRGTFVGMDVHSIMHDPEIYPRPNTFDPFRFARMREVNEAVGGSDRESESDKSPVEGEKVSWGGTVESQRLSLTATSSTFLPFGHGRSACPGRFLVSPELKMLLAYITMFYEIEPIQSRPENIWFGQNVIPPMKATIRVRRRKAQDVGV